MSNYFLDVWSQLFHLTLVYYFIYLALVRLWGEETLHANLNQLEKDKIYG